MSKPFVIGLTGNIATGKSLVMGLLEQMGAVTIDADKLVHVLMRRGHPLFLAVVTEFGRDILDVNYDIDRGKLGRIVFDDPAALARLEHVTHPVVKRVVAKLIARAGGRVVVVEAIKLIESGMAQDFDAVWVVTAPREVQLERLMTRRGLSPSDAVTRVNAQLTDAGAQADKVARADVVIENGGDEADTRRAVEAAFATLPVVVPGPRDLPCPGAGRRQEDPLQTPDVEVHRAAFAELPALSSLLVGSGVALDGEKDALLEWFLSRGLFVAVRAGAPSATASLATTPQLAVIQDVAVSRGHLWPIVGRPLLAALEEEGRQVGCDMTMLHLPPAADTRAFAFFRRNGYEVWPGPDLITMDHSMAALSPARAATLLVKSLLRREPFRPI